MVRAPIEMREDLIVALSEAAEFEHGIICQYLFAAFSLKTHVSEGPVTWPQLERVREWKAELLLIARQEMEHLGIVCNLLTAIGGAPHFRRPHFPHAIPYCPSYPQFELQRFCQATIERFACLEQSHHLACDDSGTPHPSPDPGETIGTLYHRIQQGFEKASQHNSTLFMGPREAQVANEHLGLPPGHFDMNVLTVEDLESAVKAIDHILEAGVSGSHHDHPDHSERFAHMLGELDHIARHDPDFDPARPVARNPVSRSPHSTTALVTRVTQPETCQAVELFNRAYDTMILMLTRFYAHADETPQELEGLLKTAFFPLMTAVIRPLGEMLTLMPIHSEPGRETAGPSFEFYHHLPLQPFRRSAWAVLHERLRTLVTSCDRLCLQLSHLPTPWAETMQPRWVLLHENLEQIASNFERYMSLKQAYVEHLLKRIV